MKTILQHLATYNNDADAYLSEVLAKLNPTELTAKRKGFFENIEQLYSHLIGAEVLCLSKVKENVPTLNFELSPEMKQFVGSDGYLNSHLSLPFTTLKTMLPKVHATYQAMLNQLTDTDLHKVFLFRGKEMMLDRFIVRMHNHAVHHRGQISQLLDEMGIKHDLIRLD